MVAEGRPCDEVLTQMTATKKAMEAAATLILHEFLNVCAAEGLATEKLRNENTIAE